MEDIDEEQVLQTCPTLEEFTQLVKEYFECDFGPISEAAQEKYFQSDKVRYIVESRYKESVEKLKNAEITARIFRIGCAASVAECLSLMYSGPVS
ncbi:MAG: hypothetical protein LUD51_01335 [Clostridia bacterium]|nr:hypothetical protein [Clostridia bacterium]